MLHDPTNSGHIGIFLGALQWATSILAVVVGYVSGGDSPDVDRQETVGGETRRSSKSTSVRRQGSHPSLDDGTQGNSPNIIVSVQANRPVSDARKRTQGVDEMSCPESDQLREVADKVRSTSSEILGNLKQRIDEKIKEIEEGKNK